MVERSHRDDARADRNSVSVRQRLHAATGDRDAEAEALADAAGDEVSIEDAKVAVQLAHGERGARATTLEHDIATPADAEVVHDARTEADGRADANPRDTSTRSEVTEPMNVITDNQPPARPESERPRGPAAGADQSLPQAIVGSVAGRPSVDQLAGRVQRIATATRRRFGRTIEPVGSMLGHPVHPMLTDLPIGFWTSASVLDVVGGRTMRPAARRLIAAGVLSAVPTALTGLHDAGDGGGSAADRRVVALHASCNAAATVAYACSWRARHHDRWGRGVLLALVGATFATAGGLLGGELAFGGTDAHESPEPDPIEEQGIVDLTEPAVRAAAERA